MASDVELRGVYVPLVTPFAGDGSVAVDAIERLCHEYIDAGAAGIVALGTTGEAPALDGPEKRVVIDACGRVCRERAAQLIVGAGTNNTAASVAGVEQLADVDGLAAVLAVVPYYVRPSEAGIVEHFKVVAAASPAPLVVYNIPYRTGRGLGPASILELAHVPNVAGLKQAVGGVDADTLEVLAGAPAGFFPLCGDDPFIFPMTVMGGTGAIAASAHVCTDRFVAMVECAFHDKIEEGRAYAQTLLPVCKKLFAEPSPGVTKGVLHAHGRIPTPDLRLPMTRASQAAIDAAMTAIAAAAH